MRHRRRGVGSKKEVGQPGRWKTDASVSHLLFVCKPAVTDSVHNHSKTCHRMHSTHLSSPLPSTAGLLKTLEVEHTALSLTLAISDKRLLELKMILSKTGLRNDLFSTSGGTNDLVKYCSRNVHRHHLHASSPMRRVTAAN